MSHVVDLEWQGDLPEFYCPVCGKAVTTENGPSDDICGHVKFLYVDEVGEFEFIDSNYESLLKEFDYESDDDQIEFLMKKVKSESAIAFNLTTSGIACGPVSSSVTYGVDFNPNN